MTSYSTQSLPARRLMNNDLNFSEKIHQLLTERECNIFDKGLSIYHKRRDVRAFVECLSMVLNTNRKRQLLIQIRENYVKPSDLVKFNNQCIKFGIALPSRGTLPKKQQKRMSVVHDDQFHGPKLIEVKREKSGDWGFSFRGGIELGMGIFISWVDKDSNAEKAGLRIGDYVHRVDETNFDGLTKEDALQFFRNYGKVVLLVTSFGKIPGFHSANKQFMWVDRNGKPAQPPPEEGDLKMDILDKEVSMTIEPGMELGISIRGGAEHGLGIYVSVVDPASVADLHGIQPGNQILEVNGITFYNILHGDAAKALRSQRTMVMKLKDVGRIPKSRIPAQRPVQPSVQPYNLSNNSLPSRPPPNRGQSEIASSAQHQTRSSDSPMLIRKPGSHAKTAMNEMARSVLTKSEMSAFTYYITQYETDQMDIEVLVNKLLKLLNTREKIQILSEVRNIVQHRDSEKFNELTLDKEIGARKQPQQGRYHNESPLTSDDDEMGGSSNPVQLRHKQLKSDEMDFGDLDEIPVRLSPINPATSTPADDHDGLIARKMRERRHKLHESVLSTADSDGWDEFGGYSHSKSKTDATLAVKLRELKLEHEMEKKKLLEEKGKEFEEEKDRLVKETKQETEQELRKQVEENVKRDISEEVRKVTVERLEKEYSLKLEESLREEKEKAREEKEKREKLEEEMKGSFKNEIESKIRFETKTALEKQFEEKIEKTLSSERSRTESEMKRRVDLENEVRSTWEKQLQQQKELNDKLEKNVQDERKRGEEERKRREELEKEMMKKTALSFEEKDKLRSELEDKLKKEAEERLKREKEERLAQEAREKARLEEEIQSNRALRDQLEEERRKRESIEREKRELLEQKEKAEREMKRIQEEKEKLEEKIRTRRNSVDLMKKRTALESQDLENDFSQTRMRRIAEEEQLKRIKEEEEQLKRIAEEERRLRMLEQEEEVLRLNEEIAEQRRLEIDEEQDRQQEIERRRKEAAKMEKELAKKEKERARKAEEERLKQLQEEEERKQAEEEERQRQELAEAERQRKEEEQRAKWEKEAKEKAAKSKDMSGFAMDDIVSEMAKISPMPSPREGHVSFQDQNKKQQASIEQDRKKAEKLLRDRMKKQAQQKPPADGEEATDGTMSYGGYTGLKGKIVKVNVVKVNRKLGIAVDGGANTNQKAVIIRQIVPEGSAAQTGSGMAEGQQILTINGKSLKGLKHKDAVTAIKSAFDGPLNKTIEFVLLAHDDDDD